MTAISTTLRESVYVGCSAKDAHRYLIAHFITRNRVAPPVVLRVPVGDLALDHPVVMTLSDMPSRAGEFVMEVSWSATDGGPYPTFIGSLACLPETAIRSRIELEGAYTIPGGPIGKAFDAAIGHRIAEAAAHSLMDTLFEIIENARDIELAANPKTVAAAYPPTYE